MQNLTVTFVQTELVWEDIPANLEMLDEKIEAINNPTDLILLPEMFSTEFSMSPATILKARKRASEINSEEVKKRIDEILSLPTASDIEKELKARYPR